MSGSVPGAEGTALNKWKREISAPMELLFQWYVSFLEAPQTKCLACACVWARSCLTPCDPMDCSLPGSSAHGIAQAGILEWVAIPFSIGSSQLRDWTRVSCIGRWILYHWATWEAQASMYIILTIYLLSFNSYDSSSRKMFFPWPQLRLRAREVRQ